MTVLKFDWNPVTGIDIVGNFKLHFYSLMWLSAFVVGFYLMKRIYKKENIKLEYLDSLFIYAVLATMIGARVGHVLFYQPELISEDFFSIFLPFSFKDGIEFTGFQGLASHGATLGIIIGMYLYRKKYTYKSLMWIFDRMVIPVTVGAGLIRFGNFINSEIVGKVTDSALGVRFVQDYYNKYRIVKETGIQNVQEAYNAVTGTSQFKHLLEAVPYRHPAQLYEAICYFLMFPLFWYIYNKTKKGNQTGFMFGLFFVLLWTVRFFVEFVKEAQVEGREDWVFNSLNTGQVLSIPFILIGLYFMFGYKQKTKA